MNTDRLRELAEGWRGEAVVLRKRGAAAQAEAPESGAAENEQALQGWNESACVFGPCEWVVGGF